MLPEIIHLSPAWIALAGTIAGTIGLKLVEHWLNGRSETRADRADFRDEIKGLNDRVDKLETELATWRERYYAAQEQILTLKAMMIGAGIKPPKDE